MNRRKFKSRVKMKGPRTYRDLDFMFRMLDKPLRPPVLQHRR